jgi:hypothetical protein
MERERAGGCSKLLFETSQESQNDALEGSKGLLKDLNLWPLGSTS